MGKRSTLIIYQISKSHRRSVIITFINEELRNGIKKIVEQHKANLYDLENVNEGGMKILRVMLTKDDGPVDLDLCTEVSEDVSTYLDEVDTSTSEYYLEVCSAGAERELRNDEEIKQAVGNYVYLKLNKAFKSMNELKGDLLSFDNNVLKLAYMDKAVKRQAEINREDISFIRLSVRI